MKNLIKLAPLGLLAVLLSQCTAEDTQNLLNSAIEPKVIITTSKGAKVTIEALDFEKDKKVYIDVNNNFKRDEGEDLVSGRAYYMEGEQTFIYGEVKALTLTSAHLKKVVVSNRHVQSLRFPKSAELTSVGILNAQALEELYVPSCKALKEVDLPEESKKLPALKRLHIGGATLLEKVDEYVINRLPDRVKEKEKGQLRVGIMLTEAQKKALADKGWEVKTLITENQVETDTEAPAKATSFDDLILYHIKAAETKMTGVEIPFLKDGNKITKGTVIIYKTNSGRYGKMQILEDVVQHMTVLTVSAVTYNANGTVYKQNSNFLINISWLYDMDELKKGTKGTNGVDWQWESESPAYNHLSAQNGAIFAIYKF